MSLRIVAYKHAKDVPPLPGTNVFHSIELFQVLEQTPGYAPLLWVAFEDERPVGKMLCICRHNRRLLGLSDKSYVYGTGEYFPSSVPRDLLFKEFLGRFTSLYKRRSLFLEFRNLEEPLFGYRYFRQAGYFPVRWLRVRNSIHHATPDKWMSASRRRQINRGIKSGATMDEARTEADVHAFFAMFRKYYSAKIYRYLPDIQFFLTLLTEDYGKRLGKLFVIRYKEKIIGGSVCLFSGNDVYLLLSCGMRKSYPLQYPGVLAVWAAITYSHTNGYDHFEFIDAGLPFKKYTYRDFILRFGGKQLASRRWFRIRWQWLNRLFIRLYV